MSWAAVSLPLWVRWAGVAGAATAAVLLFAVLSSLGTNLTDTVVTRAAHSLVTTGPYRLIRHPFYAAFALELASSAAVTANWFLGLTGFFTVALVVFRTKIEEQKLIERFGSRYTDYMEATGRFIPRLISSRSKPLETSFNHSFSRTPIVVKQQT
jgi:protein-S-isoprenylcysteine O-methyltransferase Ste14